MDLSIIIPARNEENALGRTLYQLELLHSRIECEVLVVDAGSEDRTAQVARDHGAKIVASHANPPGVARNVGAWQAQGRLLAFLDADVDITQRWSDRICEILEDKERAENVTGYRCAIPDNAGWIERSWFGAMAKREGQYINSANMLCDAQLFRSIGGFNGRLTTGEDVDLCERAMAAGYAVLPDHSLNAVHARYPSSIGSFWTREAWHGSGDSVSLKAALRSKVVIASVLFASLLLFLVAMLAAGEWVISGGLAAMTLGLLFACSAQTFHPAGWGAVVRNMPLYACYLSARFTSLILPAEAIARVKNAQNRAGFQ